MLPLKIRRVPNVGGSAEYGSEVMDGSRTSSLNVPSDERSIISPTVPAVHAVTDAKRLGSESAQSDQQDRTNSHQVKNDHWRPIDGPNSKYVQETLEEILNLEYSGSVVPTIKHVYNQIDWRNRGYLLRHDVESHCAQAIGVSSTNNENLMKIVDSCDANRDGKHIRCDLFVLRSICTFLKQC